MSFKTEKEIRNKIYRTINQLFVELTDDHDMTLQEFEVMLLEEIARGLKLAETSLPVIPNR